MNDLDSILNNVTPSFDGIVRNYKPVAYDFGSFDKDIHPEVRKMYRETQWFVNDVMNKVRPRRWLSLLGGSGIGKTFLAKSASDILKREWPGLSTQFWKWQNVVSMLREGNWDLIDHLVSNVNVLVLDDVGTENVTDVTKSALNRIADGRLEKWTIITSNLLPDNFRERVDARVSSRLYRGNNVICQSTDARDYCYERKRNA